MPYYQREWNAAVGDAKTSSRKVRTCPATDTETKSSSAKVPPPPPVDKMKVTFKREMLKKQVEELQITKCADPIKDDPNYGKYQVQKEGAIFEGKHSSVYHCSNATYGDAQLVCRIYQPSAQINPENDRFLRVLRVLGKKHPCILSTMDIYFDEGTKQIYLFQEFANKGNLGDYVRTVKSVPEKQVAKWAQSVYRAMEYLGDVGIVHRSIQPKHILLKGVTDTDIVAKLSSFRDAVVYYDPETHDLIDQPCKPVAKRVYFAFQAPEVFGASGEFYSPVEADVWSLGASMFFVAARQYPYNLKTPSSNMDAEIGKTVAGSKLTDGAKTFFTGILHANTTKRTQFDAVAHDPWFKSV